MSTSSAAAGNPPLIVEITAVFQLDCMIAGIVPHPTPQHVLAGHQSHIRTASTGNSSAAPSINGSTASTKEATTKSASAHLSSPALTSFLVVAYTPPDTSLLTGNEATTSRAEQARKAAQRPELRIVSRAGEELAADALGISGFERWGCNDYVLVDVEPGLGDAGAGDAAGGRYYVVLSPNDVVVVKPRDWKDHVAWLVERRRYEEALEEIERRSGTASVGAAAGAGEAKGDDTISAAEIGQRYIEHLISEGEAVSVFCY